MSKIEEGILSILGECRVEGSILFLPDRQLDRATYLAVNKVLEVIGGKWNRKAKGHVFTDGDPDELLNNVLLTGEVTDLKKEYQFFPTPRPIAERMCDMAELEPDHVVLEPSCGKGDLADVIFERGIRELYCFELNPDMERYLKDKPYSTVTGIDFLSYARGPQMRNAWWDRIIMNPPFTRQQDIDHILTAYELLSPDGVLVSVSSVSPFFRDNKKSLNFRSFLEDAGAEIHEVDEGAFKESGTMVRTKLIKLRRQSR